MTATHAVPTVRARPSARLPRYVHRRGVLSRADGLDPTRVVPVRDRRVPTGGDPGGDRLRRALDHIQQQGPPATIAGWKALAEGLLVDERCAADRNRQISSCYAWAYLALPTSLKWAGMAAIASHHVRVALLPLHLQSAFGGSPAQARRPVGWRVLRRDVDTLRATNNAIFDDLFWVHLAYVTAEDGIGLLRTLLRDERGYAPVLVGFEAIDRGRRVLEDPTASPAARGRAHDLVWEGNLLLLEHEQRIVVQPRFDRLSDRYAGVVSLGSATSFEARGPCRSIEHFTSFFLYTLARTNPRGLGGRVCPRITRYDDRWRWLVSSVVPGFRRVDADPLAVRAILRRILDEDLHHAPSPCSRSVGEDQVPREPAAPARPGALGLSPLGGNAAATHP